MRAITPQELLSARLELSGISRKSAYELCGVNRTTWRRWEMGKSRIPHAAYELIRIFGTGRLPSMGADWDDWHFHDGKLWTPAGVGYTPGDILATHFLEQAARRLRTITEHYTLQARLPLD